MNFRGANVVISGGSSGIGFATAKLLARREANVFIIARNQERLAQALGEIEKEKVDENQLFEAFSADVRRYREVEKVIATIVEKVGSPDVLVNSAGICHSNYFEALPLSAFEDEMGINYLGTLYMIRAVLPHMKANGAGHIVNISSVAGYIGGFGYSSYSPSKFAVCGLSEVLRGELAPYNIMVSVMFPFDTDTPMLEEENKTKPLETKMITGAVKPEGLKRPAEFIAWGLVKLFTAPPASPEKVANALIEGIQKEKHLIIPDFGMKLLYYVMPLRFLVNWVSKQMVSLARREYT
ncbi:MAG: SDR family oxidoreductase [Chloroflexota bacterium]|nr:SDR family oxidoreductase [Chloroflexota bacterium]